MKDPNLRLILNEIKPDIFTVNEMSSSQIVHQHMLDKNLNTGGINHYRKVNYNPTSSSNIVNMLYYDSRKLRLKNRLLPNRRYVILMCMNCIIIRMTLIRVILLLLFV